MKHFLTTLFIVLALVTSIVGVVSIGAPIVHAGTVPPAAGGGALQTPASGVIGADVPAQFGTIMTWIMSLFAWLVGAAALTLDWAAYYTVVTMGTYVSHITAIGLTWRILRDLGNIVLIFGFLAVGISIILNTERLGYGKRMLPTLLIVAVFLNFSLFISEAVIDAGNLFATQFYTQINGGTLPNLSTLTPSSEGISNKIMAQLGLQTAYGQFRTNIAATQGANTWFIGFMGIILFIVTAFVMFSLAFILIARFVILILLIIIAPIGFAGLVVPKLEGAARGWWSELFNQTITAPVLFLLLYVALAVITDAQFLTGICSGACTENWLGFVSGNSGNYAGFASIMLSFLIAMGLLLSVIIVSKKMSAFGSSVATKWAGAVTFGATAFATRATLGSGSRYISQRVRTSRIGATKTGRLLATTFDRGARASFDIRGATAFGGLKAAGIDAGAAAKGGYEARRAGKIKAHEAYVKSIDEANKEHGPSEADNTKAVETVKAAKEKKRAVEAARDTAKEENKAVGEQVAQQKAEVTRLESINKSNRDSGIFDQQNTNDLKAARLGLATSEANLDTAAEKLKKAEKEFSDVDKDKALTKTIAQTFEEAAESAMKDRVKGQKEQYAENITGFTSWVLFGPNGSAAARKIKASSKEKSDEVKFSDLAKKIAKDDADAETGGGESEKPKKEGSEPKPSGEAQV